MKAINRGLAVLLAGVLILGGSPAFAVSPNANPNAMKMNPARIKAMEMVQKIFTPVMDLVDDVEVKILPMENGNVGVIEGRVVLKRGYSFEDFKGNTKIKVKLNNVTVNIDQDGSFSQPMPLWKAQVLHVGVYVGRALVYSSHEDDLDHIKDKIDLERALDRAEAAIGRLPEDLEDLTLDHIRLVERARIAVDMLGQVIDEGSTSEKRLYRDYLDIVEEAEEIIWDLVARLIDWEIELKNIGDETYYGKLEIKRDFSDRILVVVDLEDGDDIELEISASGHVLFETDEDEFKVYVKLDGVIIPDLTVEIE